MRSLSVLAALLMAAPLPLARSQSIVRTSAPAIGKTLRLEYASAPGNAYFMFVALPPMGSLAIPGIGGTFKLNTAFLVQAYGSFVPAGGVDSVGLAVPNDPLFLGVALDFQALDLALPATWAFSTNTASLTFTRGIGTVTLLEGATYLATTGALDPEDVSNASAGAPVTKGLGQVAVQTITHFSQDGFLRLVSATGTTTVQAEMTVDTGKVVARDAREPYAQHIECPNGYDLYVMRDAAKPDEFYLLSLHRATGVAKELTGSRVKDTGVFTPPTTFAPSNYLSVFAFTPDGEIAAAVQHDSTNSPTGNVGPADRVVLIKTDFNKTWANSLGVIDVSPAPPAVMHTLYNGGIRILNGVLMVEGEEPSGTTGQASIWACAADGTAKLVQIPVPNSGTNLPFYYAYSVWRATQDGKTCIFLIGASSTSSTADMDLMAVTNISPAGPIVVKNVTAFPVSTQIQTLGNSAIGANNLRGALSPDGKNAAIILGGNSTTVPGNIAIVPTDGSKAGTVTAFTAGQFDPKVIAFAELWWLDNNRLLFSAGSATSGPVDYYVYDMAAAAIAPVTKTTDGAKTAPFCAGGTNTGTLYVMGSFLSDNGKYFYFVRRSSSTTPNIPMNVVGLDTASLALFDVTGADFSSGTTPATRGYSTTIYTWLFRRSPATSETFFVAGKASASSSAYPDDEIWKFDPEAGTAAVQLTANNATGTTSTIVRIDDNLALRPGGLHLAWSQGKGTSTANPESVYVLPVAGGTPRLLSVVPATGGICVGRGTVAFTPAPVDGVVWVEGTNSRTVPSANTVAWWNGLAGGTPLRLTAPPAAATKYIYVGCTSPLNP